MTSEHQRLFPEQYTHPLVGKRVRVRGPSGNQAEGVVERVFRSPFGWLAKLEGGATNVAWPVTTCLVLDEDRGGEPEPLVVDDVLARNPDIDPHDVCVSCGTHLRGSHVCPNCLYEQGMCP